MASLANVLNERLFVDTAVLFPSLDPHRLTFHPHYRTAGLSMKSAFVLFCLVLAGCTLGVFAQYENVRCKCLCPDPGLVSDNFNRSSRKLYIGNGPPDLCNCDNVVLPRLGDSMQPKAREFCPRCQCKYESRDIYMIRFSVILIIGSISFLLIYMFFLMILDPWIHKHSTCPTTQHPSVTFRSTDILRNNYQEHFSEEVSLEAQGEFASRQMFASP